MTLTKLKMYSFEDEEYLIASAIIDSGDKLESEVALKLFEVNASTQAPSQTNLLQDEIQKYKQQQIKQATQNSNGYTKLREKTTEIKTRNGRSRRYYLC